MSAYGLPKDSKPDVQIFYLYYETSSVTTPNKCINYV